MLKQILFECICSSSATTENSKLVYMLVVMRIMRQPLVTDRLFDVTHEAPQVHAPNNALIIMNTTNRPSRTILTISTKSPREEGFAHRKQLVLGQQKVVHLHKMGRKRGARKRRYCFTVMTPSPHRLQKSSSAFKGVGLLDFISPFHHFLQAALRLVHSLSSF